MKRPEEVAEGLAWLLFLPDQRRQGALSDLLMRKKHEVGQSRLSMRGRLVLCAQRPFTLCWRGRHLVGPMELVGLR